LPSSFTFSASKCVLGIISHFAIVYCCKALLVRAGAIGIDKKLILLVYFIQIRQLLEISFVFLSFLFFLFVGAVWK